MIVYYIVSDCITAKKEILYSTITKMSCIMRKKQHKNPIYKTFNQTVYSSNCFRAIRCQTPEECCRNFAAKTALRAILYQYCHIVILRAQFAYNKAILNLMRLGIFDCFDWFLLVLKETKCFGHFLVFDNIK